MRVNFVESGEIAEVFKTPDGFVESIIDGNGDKIWQSTIFTFGIRRGTVTNYEALYGMTWGNWISSRFNTDGYKVGSDDYIYTFDGAYKVNSYTFGAPKIDSKIEKIAYSTLSVEA